MLEARSALCGPTSGGVDGADGRRTLRLGEIRDFHLVQVGTFARSAPDADAAVRATLGTGLPSSTREVLHHGPHRIYRIAADQYWIVTPSAAVEGALRAALAGGRGAVTGLSTARTRLAIGGAGARALLGHLVALDLDDTVFPVGYFAHTGLHHTGVLLERVAPARYELYALRTFAQSTWEVLLDAALPFGYDLGIERVGTG